MGIGFGVIIGLIINTVLFYLTLRNFLVGKKKIAYVFLSILMLFCLVSLFIFVGDGDTDILTAFGWAPFYFLSLFASMDMPLGIKVLLCVAVLSVPVLMLYLFSQKNENQTINNDVNKLRFIKLFELGIVGAVLILITIASWNFWLSPQNSNSPFLQRYWVNSTPTSFYKDWGGNVYAFLSVQGDAFGPSEFRVNLNVTSDDFKPLSRYWATSSNFIYYAQAQGGKIADVSHLDSKTFGVVGGEYVRDKSGIYLRAYNKVGGVIHPEKFRPLESASKLPICWSGNEYTCNWYQDDAFIYYDGSMLSYANSNTFKLADTLNGFDDKYAYEVDFQKISKPDEKNCSKMPCIHTIGMSNLMVSTAVNSEEKKIIAEIKSCDLTRLYGFSYYVQPNTRNVCYKNFKMTSADADTLIPLEGISRSIAQVLISNIVVEEDFDFAFDKNNFYINGDVVYSSTVDTFAINRLPAQSRNGEVVINGRMYIVTMTGLVGATLR